MTSKSNIRFADAFAHYYKLKQEYEKAQIKEVSKLVGNNILSITTKPRAM